MSGFIVIYNTDGEDVDKQLLGSLTQTLKFKGPDRQKVWVDGNIGMGHALFKTTYEAEYENQPASIDNEVWITCSARIDDRENLIGKLGMKKEITLSRTPDSELILYAYRKWGEECLEHLLGDFAFAIWDGRLKKLFCARDRFGMRQLYYVHQKNTFIVGNSMRTLHQHPKISKQFNDKAIAGFLLFGDHHWLDQSITAFKNINSLKPSHYLVIKKGTFFTKKYWDVPSDIPLLHYKKESDYIEHFQEVFQTAVDDRIRTSSIVLAMSGGMDSTTIAATAARIRRTKIFDIHAVTAIYEQLIPDDERYYADLAAKQLHIPIHFINGDKFPMIKSKIITSSPMQLISPDFRFEIIKKNLQYSRVTLAGYGADNVLEWSTVKEMMTQMNPFYLIGELIKSYHQYGHIPSLGFGIKNTIKKIIPYKTDSRPSLYPTWIKPEFEKQMDLKELWNQEQSTKDTRHSRLHHNLLVPNWNTDEELYSNSLPLPEVRDPFLDIRLIELLNSFPLLPWFYQKHILRSSMKNILPSSIIKRPKTGIYNLSSAYLQQSQNSWIDTYSPTQELHDYIEFQNIPPLAGGVSNPTVSYIGLRPFFLSEWIKNIKLS